MKKAIASIVFLVLICLIVYLSLFVKKENSEANKITSLKESNNIEQSIEDYKEKVDTKLKASFDIVRVEQDGTLVAAGKGIPGDKITLMDKNKHVAVMDVNDDGEWVYIPEMALEPGVHELWLQDSSNNQRIENDVVVLTVPERGNDEIIAVKLDASGEDVTVLQIPDAENVETPIDISSVNYLKNRLVVAGKIFNNDDENDIRIYVDTKFVGNAVANKNETWKAKIKTQIKKGVKYTIRADYTDKKGSVIGRIEVPFEIGKGLDASEKQSVKVVKGDCLWTIAKYIYGHGEAYTMIYQANKKKIKNPNLIYPNQVFVIPTK